MRLSTFLLRLLPLLLPLATVATVYIYLYPAFQQCAFPAAQDGQQAPFRLLTFADPQLEGDTSLPKPNAPLLPSLDALRNALRRGDGIERMGDLIYLFRRHGKSLLRRDIPQLIKSYRKRLDLWGNDQYLAHIYRLMHWWSNPTHVVVLGDLLGSQWISDDEFARRTDRFWGTVFSNAHKVDSDITSNARVEILGADEVWKHRIIAVAGNHDIGYAGDITRERIARFEEAYGSVNWEVRFALNSSDNSPELRLSILNSMNLDTPAFDDNLRGDSVDFLQQHLRQDHLTPKTATILLTHIPLYKDSGICIDGPLVKYFPAEWGAGIKEQNHLAYNTSESILNALVGEEHRDRKALILNGHDHEGCHVYHALVFNDAERVPEGEAMVERPWAAYTYSSPEGALRRNPSFVGAREITVRSMMGEFGGNAGLVSAWWDDAVEEWNFEYSSCEAGVQHIWWAVHVVDLIALAIGLAGLLVLAVEELNGASNVDLQKKTV